MISLGDRKAVAIDIDDTLVIWSENGHTYRPHMPHIEALKRHHERGHHVTVWSAGGGAWAERIVKEFKLEPYVDVIMSKFSWYIDDKPADTWMQRYFLEESNVRPIIDQIKASVSVHTGPSGPNPSLPVPNKSGEEKPTPPTGPRVS